MFGWYTRTHTHTHIYIYNNNNKINLAAVIIVDYSENQVKLGEIPSYSTSVEVAYM